MVSAILNAMMSLFLPKLRKCKQGKKKKKQAKESQERSQVCQSR